MIDDRQEHRLPADPAALDQFAFLDGRADSAALLESLRAMSTGCSAVRRARQRARRALVERPRYPPRRTDRHGFAPDETLRRVGEWRVGPRALAALPRGAYRVRGDAPQPYARGGAGPDPSRSLNRFEDLIERLPSGVNFYRLLEARPQLAALVAQILTHAPALADQLARRPTLLDGLIDDSAFAPPPDAGELSRRFAEAIATDPLDIALDRVRRMATAPLALASI